MAALQRLGQMKRIVSGMTQFENALNANWTAIKQILSDPIPLQFYADETKLPIANSCPWAIAAVVNPVWGTTFRDHQIVRSIPLRQTGNVFSADSFKWVAVTGTSTDSDFGTVVVPKQVLPADVYRISVGQGNWDAAIGQQFSLVRQMLDTQPLRIVDYLDMTTDVPLYSDWNYSLASVLSLQSVGTYSSDLGGIGAGPTTRWWSMSGTNAGLGTSMPGLGTRTDVSGIDTALDVSVPGWGVIHEANLSIVLDALTKPFPVPKKTRAQMIASYAPADWPWCMVAVTDGNAGDPGTEITDDWLYVSDGVVWKALNAVAGDDDL